MAVSRVRVTKATRAYWPRTCQVFDFTKDEIVIGELAQHLADNVPECVEVLDAEPDVSDDPDGPGVDIDGDGVPEGSAKQVLAWVGDDPERAALALEAEHAREKPRSVLTADLEKLAGAAQ